MRFDIYGRFQLDVVREGRTWAAYRVAGEGKRQRVPELAIPAHLEAEALADHLDDLLHELAHPGATIRRIS